MSFLNFFFSEAVNQRAREVASLLLLLVSVYLFSLGGARLIRFRVSDHYRSFRRAPLYHMSVRAFLCLCLCEHKLKYFSIEFLRNKNQLCCGCPTKVCSGVVYWDKWSKLLSVNPKEREEETISIWQGEERKKQKERLKKKVRVDVKEGKRVSENM